MKRTTPDDLERRAFESGAIIERDTVTNTLFVTIGRETFYASLPDPAVTR